ncbi:DUF3793 family protein [bacterium]|nr:DUF3793 family protein [bacterium]
MDRNKKEDQQDYLLKHLVLRLAPVLVGIKPASLLSLCNCEYSGENHYDLWQKQKEDVISKLGISFRELKDTSRGEQVLFYNDDVLFNRITQPENLIFLKRFEYSFCQGLEDYLEMLKARFNGSSFPHEIGLFLGYPLKDVKGFIEKKSFPLPVKCRWQVFYRPDESMRLMNMYKKAERVFLNFIENKRNPMLFIDRVSNHFKKVGSLVTVN